MEFGQLFTRLCDLKQKFREEGDEESMTIQFEESATSNNVKSLFY